MNGIKDLTLRQIEEIQKMTCALPTDQDSFIKPGDSVFIRTVTLHYTGKVEKVSAKELLLSSAAWIADDGRFATALSNGEFSEVEPYPNDARVVVNRDAILDMHKISFALPRTQK